MAEIRAAQLQEAVLTLRDLGEELERRVLAELPPGALARIREASRVAWLSVEELNEPLVRAVHAHAGADGLRAWARAAALRSAGSRFFGPIVAPMARMLGLSSSVLLRVPPTAYRATFRGMGELVPLSSDPCCARFALRRLPPGLRHDLIVIVVAGAIEAALAHARSAGHVVVLPAEEGADAHFEARWPLAEVGRWGAS